jgi:hypothetical protein
MQKSEWRRANPVALPGLSTAILSTRPKFRRAARALPGGATLPLAPKAGSLAEIISAPGPHVQLNPRILSESLTIRPEPPGHVRAQAVIRPRELVFLVVSGLRPESRAPLAGYR